MSDAQDIVRYYNGQGRDDRGRRLADIQKWSDQSLETVHDFIQWMFPLLERSSANPSAPILDGAAVRKFRSSPELQVNLRHSFVRMLQFYGFEIQDPPRMRVTRGSNFEDRRGEWMSPENHNYLRITRILKSLLLLGLEEEAHAFYACLSELYRGQDQNRPMISELTFSYWEVTITGA